MKSHWFQGCALFRLASVPHRCRMKRSTSRKRTTTTTAIILLITLLFCFMNSSLSSSSTSLLVDEHKWHGQKEFLRVRQNIIMAWVWLCLTVCTHAYAHAPSRVHARVWIFWIVDRVLNQHFLLLTSVGYLFSTLRNAKCNWYEYYM